MPLNLPRLLRKADYADPAEQLYNIAAEHCKTRAHRIAQSRLSSTPRAFPAPDGLAYLPFQRSGISYMLEHKRVLLGDEMGLGKAIQILGLISADHAIRSALIVVPGGLRDNWLRESKKWLIRKPRLISAQDLPLNPDEHSIHRYLRVPQDGEDMPETLVVASYDDIVVKPWILEPNPCVGQPASSMRRSSAKSTTSMRTKPNSLIHPVTR